MNTAYGVWLEKLEKITYRLGVVGRIVWNGCLRNGMWRHVWIHLAKDRNQGGELLWTRKEHLNISGLTAYLLVKSCRRFGAACVHRQGPRVQATPKHRRWRSWGRARNCEFILMPYGLWHCVVSYVVTPCSEDEGRIFFRNAGTTYEATRCHKLYTTKYVFVIASILSINLQLLVWRKIFVATRNVSWGVLLTK